MPPALLAALAVAAAVTLILSFRVLATAAARPLPLLLVLCPELRRQLVSREETLLGLHGHRYNKCADAEKLERTEWAQRDTQLQLKFSVHVLPDMPYAYVPV